MGKTKAVTITIVILMLLTTGSIFIFRRATSAGQELGNRLTSVGQKEIQLAQILDEYYVFRNTVPKNVALWDANQRRQNGEFNSKIQAHELAWQLSIERYNLLARNSPLGTFSLYKLFVESELPHFVSIPGANEQQEELSLAAGLGRTNEQRARAVRASLLLTE